MAMAGVRAEVLLVLTCALLLVPVLGWERIDGSQLISMYEAGQRGETEQWGEPVIPAYSGKNLW